MELSFCDLRAKEVINVCDGKRLGNVIDIIIDCRHARVCGIVVPFDKGFLNIFKGNQDIFIPWNKIVKIGRDVVLVELTPHPAPIRFAEASQHHNVGAQSYSPKHNNKKIDKPKYQSYDDVIEHPESYYIQK